LLVEQDLKSERGVVLVMGLVVIILVLLMAVLVIDVQLAERTGRMMQRAVDSAALAGATQLDPQAINPTKAKQAWYQSKRATVALLRAGKFYGDGGLIAGVLTPTEGSESNPYENQLDPNGNGIYSFVSYSLGAPIVKVEIKIERGVFYRIGTMASPEFVALENGSECRDFTFQDEFCATLVALLSGPNTPTFRFANATRVTTTLKHLPTIFARLQYVTIGEFGDITRIGMAAQDIE